MNRIQIVPVSFEGWHEEQQAWNGRSGFFVNMHTREDRMAQVTDFLHFLESQGISPQKGEATLDIGCGVGDYALGLARQGAKATGIDLSNGMIEGAKSLADEEALSLQLYVGPWSEETRQALHWESSFDLAYSIFCPVMFIPDNIRAMHKASRKHCLWVAFSEREDEFVDRLWNHFFGKDGFPWDGKMKECLDTIHEIGHDVQISYKTMQEVERFTLKDAVDYFAMRLHSESWGSLEAMKEEIQNIIEPYVKDGYIENHTVDTVAWVSWSVI